MDQGWGRLAKPCGFGSVEVTKVGIIGLYKMLKDCIWVAMGLIQGRVQVSRLREV